MPSAQAITPRVGSLLTGVFLERHGKLLSFQNLRPFEVLKDNYEVGFYLK